MLPNATADPTKLPQAPMAVHEVSVLAVLVTRCQPTALRPPLLKRPKRKEEHPGREPFHEPPKGLLNAKIISDQPLEQRQDHALRSEQGALSSLDIQGAAPHGTRLDRKAGFLASDIVVQGGSSIMRNSDLEPIT